MSEVGFVESNACCTVHLHQIYTQVLKLSCFNINYLKGKDSKQDLPFSWGWVIYKGRILSNFGDSIMQPTSKGPVKAKWCIISHLHIVHILKPSFWKGKKSLWNNVFKFIYLITSKEWLHAYSLERKNDIFYNLSGIWSILLSWMAHPNIHKNSLSLKCLFLFIISGNLILYKFCKWENGEKVYALPNSQVFSITNPGHRIFPGNFIPNYNNFAPIYRVNWICHVK